MKLSDLVSVNQVDPGTYNTVATGLKFDTEKEVAYINFALHEEKEIPAATFRYTHPQGARLLLNVCKALEIDIEADIPDDGRILLSKPTTVKCAYNDSWLNTQVVLS